jgi:hypothetical protein
MNFILLLLIITYAHNPKDILKGYDINEYEENTLNIANVFMFMFMFCTEIF